MQHPLNITPSRLVLDGREWVPAEWADSLADKLREKQRSTQTHKHQFAAIHDLYDNLPVCHKDAPYAASREASRKHGLIQTGHCDVDTVVFETRAAAMAAAPFIADLARKAHGYALTVVRGTMVVCSTPHSQSFKAMGKERFQSSKSDVLAWAETLLGVGMAA